MPRVSEVFGHGDAANRPAATAEIEGYFYFSEDTGDFAQVQDGAWVTVALGGGGSGLQYVDVQLNNAQIKALRASSVEILPAPGEGFAYIPAGDSWELYDVTQAGWTAGSTQRADVGLLGIGDNAGDMVALWFSLDNDSLLDSGLVAASTHDEGRGPTSTLYPRNDSRISNYDNCPLIITNSGDAEYGGGDPANTVSLRIGYRLVPTVPFGA